MRCCDELARAPVLNWDRGTPEDADLGLVRPFTLTSGRTHSRVAHLTIDSLLVAATVPEGLLHERRSIARLCTSPVSLAELAGRLRVPLGATRVLVGDLIEEGVIALHRRPSAAGAPPDVGLLERVLTGLQAL